MLKEKKKEINLGRVRYLRVYLGNRGRAAKERKKEGQEGKREEAKDAAEEKRRQRESPDESDLPQFELSSCSRLHSQAHLGTTELVHEWRPFGRALGCEELAN